MDFGVLGLQGFVNPDGGASSSEKSDHEIKRKGITGSGSGEDVWKSSKVGRNGDSMPLHIGTPLLRSNNHEQMLSFSSLKNGGFPNYHHTRNAGYGSASLNGTVHQPFVGVRGTTFTPPQWIELEHQALIYKYITANVPVPSNLLIPLRKSINPFGLSSSFSGSYPTNSLGWGSFHLGYSGNTDPEPGRCRRTDGKKWRCSRDAVADQKYCERHINRGRHRSRKPVEGQTGQAYPGTTNSRVVPMTSSISTSSVVSTSAASNSLVIPQNQFKSVQTDAVNPSAEALVNRIQDTESITMRSSTTNLKSSEYPYTIPKQDFPFGGTSHSEFGLVPSDSLLNPSQKMSYMNSKNCYSFLGFNDPDTQVQHPLRHFIDNWPKDQSSRSVIPWPEELKSDWTQLSMSLPMASSDFSSSSSSPTQDKLAHSPLKLSSHEFDQIQMGLMMNNDLSDSSQKKTNWLPIPWVTSLGGPLGEVLTSTASTGGGTCNNSSALNLLTESSEVSQYLGSSPTGVLQKSTFASLSNSSSGSSPKADNKNHDGVISFPANVPCSTVVRSSIDKDYGKKVGF